VNPFSITPNSLAGCSPGTGEGSVDGATSPLACRLLRRLVLEGIEFLRVGDGIADVRLEIRGIFVGVSFERPDAEFANVEGGASFVSFGACELFTPTDGDPAIVGSWLRVRSDVSDCFCIELTVCEVSLDDELIRDAGAAGGTEEVEDDVDDRKLATL
jgi:hypothetical protein